MLKLLFMLFMLSQNPEAVTEPIMRERIERITMFERVEFQTYEDDSFIAFGCMEGGLCDDTPDGVRRTYIINGYEVTFTPLP